MLTKIATVPAILALLSSTTLQAAEADQCIPPETAESLITYVLPVALGAARNKCTNSLPATAALLQVDSAQMQRYVADSRDAWPEASTAIGMLVGQDLPENMEMNAFRPLIDAMIPAMLAEEIKEKDCPTINKVYKLLEPMPTSNIASLTVMVAQLGNSDKKGDKKSTFNICKAAIE
ncbi:hypothetical protein [Parasphingorhabdus cellanae]|uniref:Secreted protein n=1 Tax=Parasphingorhabdus cellanae TaxID=2806553 RepID=A0ABX7T3Q9_9SPHN|nr:hypothetical protein [Parasphingorhabdus cellanae]QTD56211.1 hypothetical protein J4G78_00970 [Parasphingorhabdus cellanae]